MYGFWYKVPFVENIFTFDLIYRYIYIYLKITIHCCLKIYCLWYVVCNIIYCRCKTVLTMYMLVWLLCWRVLHQLNILNIFLVLVKICIIAWTSFVFLLYVSWLIWVYATALSNALWEMLNIIDVVVVVVLGVFHDSFFELCVKMFLLVKLITSLKLET